jgi:cation diffusion facilitator family transporter
MNADLSEKTRYQAIKYGMWICICINLFLGIIKVIIGAVGHSSALFSDGIHSLADLIADFFTLIAGKIGSKGPDEDHPYGHKRIETFFNFGLGVILIGIAFAIGWDAVSRIASKSFVKPDNLTMWIALVSVILNEFLYWFLKGLNKKHKIPILLTNAYHARADTYSSVIVFVGILGSILGFAWFDAIAMFIVACFIGKMGVKASWSCVKELTDTAVSPEMLSSIKKIIEANPEIKSFYQLRTRSMAESVLLDFHILVADKISVSEGHFIAEKVRYNLMNNISGLADVIIHIDYQQHDDQSVFLCDSSEDKLLRSNLLSLVNLELEKFSKDGVNKASADKLIIHYIHPDDKAIGVDLILLLDGLDNSDKLERLQINKEKILALKQKLFATFKKNDIFLGNLEIYSNYGK